jgi:hypothetical protein
MGIAMTKIPMKRYWMGEDLDNLSREKLLEIIDHLNDRLEHSYSVTRSVIDINNLARKAMRNDL